MYDKVIEIVIADSDTNFINTFCEYAKGEIGFSVVDYVNSGQDVIPSVKRNDPDVLILDALLPVVDGLGVLRRLQNQTYNKPITIMTSNFSQDIYVQTAMSLGADYYLLKPINFEFLFEQIRFLTRGTRAGLSGSLKAQGIKSLLFDSKEISEEITKILHQLGIPAHLFGHNYLREAILMVVHDRSLATKLSKAVYPVIARKYGKSAASVEKAMRNALDIAWERGRTDLLNDLFGYTININKGRATNSEFIALIADKLSLKYSGHS